MNSEQPNERSKQLSLWEEFAEQSQNIQRDDSTQASNEKSALGENHALIEEVVDDTIIEMAWARVKANRGAPGPDGVSVKDFPEWFRPQWQAVRGQLLDGTYRPSPARRVSIDKPDGGTRELGIPNLLDRVIETAIVLVLTPIFDPEFSESSFGYRPYRSAQGAVKQVQKIIRGGRRWCVDMDLSKFFDRVQHDVLMARVSRKVHDKRLLKLIGRYLRAGVMVDGLCQPSEEGTRLDKWIRRRVRACYWKQWRKSKTRLKHLVSLGVSSRVARGFAMSGKGPWRLSTTSGVQRALSNTYLTAEGLFNLEELWHSLASLRRNA